MDQTEATTRLKRMVAWDTPPMALSEQAVDELIEIAKTTDRVGGHPRLADDTTANPSWLPTWDLRKAAVEGWRWKAATVAHLHDFKSDGTVYSAAQLLDQCNKMIKLYGRRPGTIYTGRYRQGFQQLGEVTIVGNG